MMQSSSKRDNVHKEHGNVEFPEAYLSQNPLIFLPLDSNISS